MDEMWFFEVDVHICEIQCKIDTLPHGGGLTNEQRM